MTSRTITPEDEGKRVVNADRRTVGVVASIEGATAYVKPEPAIEDTVLAKLGWEPSEDEAFPLDRGQIETITDDEIRLTREL